MVSVSSRFETLVLLVKTEVAGWNLDLARVLLEFLTAYTLHPIVAYDLWDKISPDDHLKLLPALCYFSLCIESQLALHFWHGVAFGTKWPQRDPANPNAFIWHPDAPGKRSIWRVYQDDTQSLPEHEENDIRAALVNLANYVRIDIAVPKNNANGSTRHGQRIPGTTGEQSFIKINPALLDSIDLANITVIDFVRRSLVVGATLTHEIAHAWWNANHGHGEDERCFETYPEQEIGLAQEWFVFRGTFSVDSAGVLTMTRLPSAGLNEAYRAKTKQLSSHCRVTVEEMKRRVNDSDALHLVDAGFWTGHVLANPLVPRTLMEMQPA